MHGTPDMLTAIIAYGGTTIAGATVNFTSSSALGVIAPSYTLSNANGTATTYITASTPTSLTVNAMFLKGCSATQSLTFS